MYNLEIKQTADKRFRRLEKRDKKQLEIINKKLNEIIQNPYQFKPLRRPLQNFRRVRIGKSFVLVYTVDELRKTVIIYNYDHHDNV
jgi:YafQ family addiction module toxin component